MKNNFMDTSVPVQTISEIKEIYGMNHLPEDGELTWRELYLVRLFKLASDDPVIMLVVRAANDAGIFDEE